MYRKTLIASAIAATLLFASGVQAHPKLVSANPAANATIGQINRIEIHFSERLMGRFSGVDLAMTDMPGMKMGAPMKMGGIKTMVGADGKTLVAMLARPLPKGTYRLNYHVVSADTHRVQGGYWFKVR